MAEPDPPSPASPLSTLSPARTTSPLLVAQNASPGTANGATGQSQSVTATTNNLQPPTTTGAHMTVPAPSNARISVSPQPLTPKSTSGTNANSPSITVSPGAGSTVTFSDGTTRRIAKERPTRLPDRHSVNASNVTNSYIDFVGYSDPSIDTSDANTLSHLDKKFNAVPKTEGKVFTTWSLFECVTMMHRGEISNWSQLVGKLGVSDVSGRPQYAQRCKRWLQKYKIDCFFDYLLGNPYDFFNVSGEYSGCLASRVKTVGGAPKKPGPKPIASPAKSLDKQNKKRKRRSGAEDDDLGDSDEEEDDEDEDDMEMDAKKDSRPGSAKKLKRGKTDDDEDEDMLENSSDDNEDEDEEEEEEDEDEVENDEEEDGSDDEEEEDQLSPAEDASDASAAESERTMKRKRLKRRRRRSRRLHKNHPFASLGDPDLDRDIQQALDMYEQYQKSVFATSSSSHSGTENGVKTVATVLSTSAVPNGIRSPSLPNGMRNILNDDDAINQESDSSIHVEPTTRVVVPPPPMLSDFAASLIARMRTSYSYNLETLKSDLDLAQSQLTQTRHDLTDSDKDLVRLKAVYKKRKATIEELEAKIESLTSDLKRVKEKHDRAIEALMAT